MDRAQLVSLLFRLREGAAISSPEEKEILEGLAVQFDRPMPKYACTACWIKRTLEELVHGGVTRVAKGPACKAGI